MKHSGLQKSISSIFDGSEPLNQQTTPTAVGQNPVPTPKPQPVQAAAAVPADVSSIAVATAPNPPSASPARQNVNLLPTPKSATRPRPVPKNNASNKVLTIKDLWKQFKSRLVGGSAKTLDSRQKKTLVLGISLAVVFVGVLFFVLGGGTSKAKAASKKSKTDAQKTDGSQSVSVDNWTKPEIYPSSLRDPMTPSSNASTAKAQDQTDMTVRGIVYSSDKPSAIIADQIVFEGDVIVGVKIIKIEKDFVEFEKEGKRWQQQVRH